MANHQNVNKINKKKKFKTTLNLGNSVRIVVDFQTNKINQTIMYNIYIYIYIYELKQNVLGWISILF